jgi:DnaJ-domain-containing protein 1
MKPRYKLHPFFEDPPPPKRTCERLGCQNTADYRAPISATRLREYHWFCLDHVREYNLSWDYYKRMSQEEIERARREDATWQRPTWKFGHNPSSSFFPGKGSDPFHFFEGLHTHKNSYHTNNWLPPHSEAAKALKILDLTLPLDAQTLKKRYKELAKKYHPDVNFGCSQSEEYLKKINQAYNTLKKLVR